MYRTLQLQKYTITTTTTTAVSTEFKASSSKIKKKSWLNVVPSTFFFTYLFIAVFFIDPKIKYILNQN